jgi:hypothetical protein
MKYSVEMGSGAITYIPSLIKTGSDIQKFIGGEEFTDTQHDDLISLLLFFQNKENRLKINSRSSITMDRKQERGIYC